MGIFTDKNLEVEHTIHSFLEVFLQIKLVLFKSGKLLRPAQGNIRPGFQVLDVSIVLLVTTDIIYKRHELTLSL